MTDSTPPSVHTVDFPYKIIIPQRPTHIVARPRLNKLLNGIVERQLITISAPAGYGKTSLLIDFATEHHTLPICWYTLDASDQDAWVFLSYLVASVEHRFPGAAKHTRQQLSGGEPALFATVLATFARDVYALGQPFVLIIDDWHLIDHVAEVSSIISALLVRCPLFHLILASRSYPGLSNMMLLAARRQMISLDDKQLCFTPEEATAVLTADADVTVSPEQAAKLTDQANGWITGMLLLLQTPTPMLPKPALSTTSAERQVYRFLTEQVFDQQPADVRTFLLESSLLEDLTPEHCDTFFQRIDSRRLLDALLRRHLFVYEIKPGVLRYQPLFREFLQEQFSILDPQRYRVIALKVADVYAAQGQWSLAFEHYLAVGERTAAQQVIAASGERLYASGRLETLEHWFGALPDDTFEVALLCLKARVLLDRGRHNEAQTLADLAETRVQPDDTLAKVTVLLLQAQIGRVAAQYRHALDLAQQALTMTTDLAQRAAALRTIAICHHRLEDTASAIDEFKQALSIEQERGDLHAVAQIQRDLGICYSSIGYLHKAEDYHTRADAYWATTGNTGLRVMSLNSKGGTQHLLGRFQEAYLTLTTALQHARAALLPAYQAAVLSNLGDLYCDLQLWELARTAYADAHKAGGSTYLTLCLEVSAIRLLVRQQQYGDAASQIRQLSNRARESQGHEIMLLQAQVACGLKHYQQAEAYVAEVIAARAAAEPSMILARAYLLQAYVRMYAQPNDQAGLLAALDQMIAVAQRLGHDAFLVIDMLHMRSLQRRVALLDWGYAEQWRLRQEDMLRFAQALGNNDHRPVLTIRTLGVDQILLDNQEVELGWHKAREVLYYLLAHPDGALIDALREAIWPNLAVERSRDALRSAIYQLRSVLPRELIVLQGRQVYRVNRSVVRLQYDCEQFLHLLGKLPTDHEATLEALDLYHGRFLATTDNDWCAEQRAYLERRYLQALNLVATNAEQQQLFPDALNLYARILAVDAFDEAAHAGVMRCHLRLGNRGAAINQYQMLRRRLDDELGIELRPDSEVEELYLHALNA